MDEIFSKCTNLNILLIPNSSVHKDIFSQDILFVLYKEAQRLRW